MNQTLTERIWSRFEDISSTLMDWMTPCTQRSKEVIKAQKVRRMSCVTKRAVAENVSKRYVVPVN